MPIGVVCAEEDVQRVERRRNQQPVQIDQADDAPGEIGRGGRTAAQRHRPRLYQHAASDELRARNWRPLHDSGRIPALFSPPTPGPDEPARIPVERSVPRVRNSRAPGQRRPQRRGGRRRRQGVRRQALGGQGPGARRRPRQGRRRQAGARPRDGARGHGRHARPAPGDQTDRSRRAAHRDRVRRDPARRSSAKSTCRSR